MAGGHVRKKTIDVMDKVFGEEIDEVVRFLEISKKKLKDIDDFMRMEGEKVKADMVSRIPRWTGNLANSVRVDYNRGKHQYTIEVREPYAAAVEYGEGPRAGYYPGERPSPPKTEGWWFEARTDYAKKLYDRYHMTYEEIPNTERSYVYSEGQPAKAFMYGARQAAFGKPDGYFYKDAFEWMNWGM